MDTKRDQSRVQGDPHSYTWPDKTAPWTGSEMSSGVPKNVRHAEGSVYKFDADTCVA